MLAVFKVVVDLKTLDHKPHSVSFPFLYPSYMKENNIQLEECCGSEQSMQNCRHHRGQ